MKRSFLKGRGALFDRLPGNIQDIWGTLGDLEIISFLSVIWCLLGRCLLTIYIAMWPRSPEVI